MGKRRRLRKFVENYRIDDGKGFRLADYDPGDTNGMKDPDQAKEWLTEDIEYIREQQEKLYAQNRWAVLLVFQAMDAAGKDSAIKHVMAGLNPQGTQVYSFKAPSSEDLDHDYLWRTSRCLPERGRIGIFNRSYYEEVLVVRVNPEILAKQRLPESLVTPRIWKQRYEDIAAHERYLVRNGIAIRKFFLHVSKAEQKRRFLERLERPEKNWKFSTSDVMDRRKWKAYMKAYEAMIRATATPHAPWFVVPADHKWFTRMVVAAAVGEALGSLDPEFPQVTPAQRRELLTARRALLAE